MKCLITFESFGHSGKFPHDSPTDLLVDGDEKVFLRAEKAKEVGPG